MALNIILKSQSSQLPAMELAKVNIIPIAPPNSGPNDRDIM